LVAPASNECSIHLELGRERTFNRQINRLGRKPGFLEGDKLEAAVTNGRWVLTNTLSCLLEMLHWADATSLEAFSRSLVQVAQAQQKMVAMRCASSRVSSSRQGPHLSDRGERSLARGDQQAAPLRSKLDSNGGIGVI
jgi:hypothetical protein